MLERRKSKAESLKREVNPLILALPNPRVSWPARALALVVAYAH